MLILEEENDQTLEEIVTYPQLAYNKKQCKKIVTQLQKRYDQLVKKIDKGWNSIQLQYQSHQTYYKAYNPQKVPGLESQFAAQWHNFIEKNVGEEFAQAYINKEKLLKPSASNVLEYIKLDIEGGQHREILEKYIDKYHTMCVTRDTNLANSNNQTTELRIGYSLFMTGVVTCVGGAFALLLGGGTIAAGAMAGGFGALTTSTITSFPKNVANYFPKRKIRKQYKKDVQTLQQRAIECMLHTNPIEEKPDQSILMEFKNGT